MVCEHNKIRCTNNVFFCVKCGQRLPDNWFEYKRNGEKAQTEEPAEQKKPTRRKGAKK